MPYFYKKNDIKIPMRYTVMENFVIPLPPNYFTGNVVHMSKYGASMAKESAQKGNLCVF